MVAWNDQKPLVCVSDEARVRLRLEGEDDSRWCGAYNELATQRRACQPRP